MHRSHLLTTYTPSSIRHFKSVIHQNCKLLNTKSEGTSPTKKNMAPLSYSRFRTLSYPFNISYVYNNAKCAVNTRMCTLCYESMGLFILSFFSRVVFARKLKLMDLFCMGMGVCSRRQHGLYACEDSDNHLHQSCLHI